MSTAPIISKAAAKRLKRIEYANYRRALHAGCAAVRVDFIAQCEAQGWACWICGEPMDPNLTPDNIMAISVEHDPALSIGGAHKPGGVFAAHHKCNIDKGRAVDTSRAAKTKRQAAKFGDGEKSEKPKRRWGSRGFQTNRDSAFKQKVGGKTVRRDA